MARNLPVTQETNEDLTDNDTNDFQVGDSLDPVRVADSLVIPAFRPDRLEQGSQVTDREQDVSEIDVSMRQKLNFSIRHTPPDRDQHREEPCS